MENIVTIKDVSKETWLTGLNAVIPKGQIVGLVGPDGAGKTTLIRLIAGLMLPTSGQIVMNRQGLGYMPQKFGLYEDLTVLQNLNLFADLQGVQEKNYDQLLEFTALAPFTNRLARNLSGGMKQKLGLACALIAKPSFLLLDEPSVGVDPISRRELWKMVHSLVDEGISVLWSTSYLDEAEKCNTVLLLNEGKLLFSGDPKELTKRVEGRVYKIPGYQGDRRAKLFELLRNPNVLDALIVGSDLRFLAKPGAAFAEEHAVPRFEDGFIDILGGGPGGESELADRSPTVEEAENHVIVAENLTKKFGSFTAVDGISLSVKKGEVFGFLGPNGAGKSTTFKMLCGLMTPTSGKALVHGIDFQVSSSEARSHIGYMAQKFSLYGHLSVRQNLEFFASVYNSDTVDEMIETFEFEPYIDTPAEQLPLGFKQRLSLACANVHHPSILFLDEPTSGVDPITRREFWNHINGLVRKGVTIMISTHFMDEAEYCDRIALIYRGKIIDLATPTEMKAKYPNNPTLEECFIQKIEAYDG